MWPRPQTWGQEDLGESDLWEYICFHSRIGKAGHCLTAPTSASSPWPPSGSGTWSRTRRTLTARWGLPFARSTCSLASRCSAWASTWCRCVVRIPPASISGMFMPDPGLFLFIESGDDKQTLQRINLTVILKIGTIFLTEKWRTYRRLHGATFCRPWNSNPRPSNFWYLTKGKNNKCRPKLVQGLRWDIEINFHINNIYLWLCSSVSRVKACGAPGNI